MSLFEKQILEKTALSNKISAANSFGLLAAGQGPYDVLGHGYNVTGEYGNAISAGFAVIAIEKFKQEQTARLIEESPRTHLLNIVSTHQSYFHSRFSLKRSSITYRNRHK